MMMGKGNLSFDRSNDVTFEFYKKNVKESEIVTFGSNGQSANCVNYIVLAITGKVIVKGDVNADRVFDIADTVMMQKWLVCAGNLTDCKAGDLC